MHLLYPLLLSVLLFATGVYGVLARRNAVLVLMSVELMLNAVNLDLVAFDAWLRDALHGGQSLTLFVITIAAAEIGVGLAIVLQVFRLRATVAVDELTDLRDPDTVPAGPDSTGSTDSTDSTESTWSAGSPASPASPASIPDGAVGVGTVDGADGGTAAGAPSGTSRSGS